MSLTYKPVGYNSISPYLIVDGAQKMIDMLQQVFDAEELRRYERADGSIMHVELRIDDSIIMLSDSSEDHPPNQHLLHVYVPDVNTTFQKAIESGCVPVESPREREDDPDIRGSFRDFAGNMWAVATQK